MAKYSARYIDGVHRVVMGTMLIGPAMEHPWQASEWARILNEANDEEEQRQQRHLEAIRLTEGQS